MYSVGVEADVVMDINKMREGKYLKWELLCLGSVMVEALSCKPEGSGFETS
jgi:hypothetical protein